MYHQPRHLLFVHFLEEMKCDTVFKMTKRFVLVSSLIIAQLSFCVDINAQCETFGFFDIGDDVEINCVDSCIQLISPSIANVAVGGANYEVEEIDYELPYPFDQGAVGISTGDDDGFAATNVPIGFNFNFYGINYTQCRLSPNGWISFNLNENAPYNPPGTIPNNNMPLNSIMGIYSDLNPTTCGDVRYNTYGEAPCREFVVSYNAVCQFSCVSNQVNAEIVLYEGSNVIEIYLGNRPSCSWGSAAVGIQNNAGNSGVSPAGFNTGNWSANTESWRFVSSEVVEGTTLWYEGDEFLGIGDTLDFCSSQTTTLTGWFSQLPEGLFCEEYDINVSNSGTTSGNQQIDWSIVSENGAVLISDDAPFDGTICLPNGCYDLLMTDSGGNGWSNSVLTITSPVSGEVGSFTLENGSMGSASFCVDDYAGPAPTLGDYIQVVSDNLEVIAVSDADAGFSFPTPLCSGDEPFQITPSTPEMGSWSVDCDECFDEATLTVDPGIAGPGPLQVVHTVDGSCFADVEALNIPIGNTPTPQFTAVANTLCYGEVFDLNVTPPYGLWTASCGDCIISTTGLFLSDEAEEGLNFVTFTSYGVCPGESSLDIGVSSPLEALVSGPSILCEEEVAVFEADTPGIWTSDCFGCMDSLSGAFDATGMDSNIWNIVFTPESYCPIVSELQLAVSESVAIGASNVPGSFCETADEFQLNVNVPGGTWSAPCGSCLDSSGLFVVGNAPIGLLDLSYSIANGACNDSSSWTVDIQPTLQASFNAPGPLCEGEQMGLSFTFDADIPSDYTSGQNGVWSSSNCPGCILNPNNGSFIADQLGTVEIEFNFNNECSTPFVGTINVEPQVDASIDPIPELCESGDVFVLQTAIAGGDWSSDCSGCLLMGEVQSFDPSVGAGEYELTYTLDGVCYDQDMVTVQVVPQRDAAVTLPDWLCLSADFVQPGFLWGGGVWSANCADCVNENSGEVNLQAAGIGLLELTHVLEGLCGDSDMATMEIAGCDVQFVNVFSPNGDGLNDELTFQYLSSFPGNQLLIFDRWGNEVYQKLNYGNNWRAEGLDEGTYYYVLNIPSKETMSGSFMLLR